MYCKRSFWPAMLQDIFKTSVSNATIIIQATILLLFLDINCYGFAAKILFVPANTQPSHAKGMYPLAEALSLHEHDVTMLQFVISEEVKTAAPKESRIRDYYLIVPSEVFRETGGDISTYMSFKYIHWLGQSVAFPLTVAVFYLRVTQAVLEKMWLKDQFDALLRDTKFELIFVDDIYSLCGMLAAGEVRRLHNASIIVFGTTILMPYSQEARGLPINKALYPPVLMHINSSFDHTIFKQRLFSTLNHITFNSVIKALDRLIPYLLHVPYTPHTSLLLFPFHSDLLFASVPPTLEFTKPTSNDIIELDMNCPTAAELPERYKSFVEDPRSKGTIIFTLGHSLDLDDMPSGCIESFVGAFTKLSDYRIIWQYATRKPESVAAHHLMLSRWIPQAALLYHRKTKVFITHTGIKSLRETICAGVPPVTMPVTSEQYRNSAIASKHNISTFLDKAALSSESIHDAITAILNDSSYQKRAQALQWQLNDSIKKPMELGRFWSEFLIRHKSSRIRKYFKLNTNRLSFMTIENSDCGLLILVLTVGLVIFLCCNGDCVITNTKFRRSQ